MGREQRLWAGLSSCMAMYSELATPLSPQFALTVNFSAFKVSFSTLSVRATLNIFNQLHMSLKTRIFEENQSKFRFLKEVR